MSKLTDREAEVLRHTSHGFSAKEIAQRLGISHRTVQEHHRSAMQKLGARNMVETCYTALKVGVIPVLAVIAFVALNQEETPDGFVVKRKDVAVETVPLVSAACDKPASSVEETEDVQDEEQSPTCKQKRK